MLTIPFEEVENCLRRNGEWIDDVIITGGEPTIHHDLPKLCRKMRELGFLVKVDTNGTNPAMIRGLIDKKLVDCIAMDIKVP